MESSIFAQVKQESPEERKAHLMRSLFKPSGELKTIPEPHLGPEAPPTEIPSGPPSPPQDFGRRVLRGTIPPKYPPPKNFPRLVRREKIIMQDIPESVPESITQNQEEDPMIKTYKPVSLSTAKDKPKSHLERTFDALKAIRDKGLELPTFNEFKKNHDKKIEPHTFYGARNKLLKGGPRATKASAIGRGKPAEVFTPSAGVNGRAAVQAPTGITLGGTFQVLYTSEESPSPEVMAELKKCIGAILASSLPGTSVDDFQFKVFSPQGFEIRRQV